MKGKLSVAAATMSFALALASPVLAEPGPSSDWFERTVAAEVRNQGATPYVDAFERPDRVGIETGATPDWFERTAAAAVRDVRVVPYVDAFERPEITSDQSTSPTVADSGSDRAWLELGIAFAIGLALAFGLVAAVRLRPNRPLTQ